MRERPRLISPRARAIPLAADRVESQGRHVHSGSSCQERVTLIEFMWPGRTGLQPVLYVDREWLH
jgi:hypothetical protein